MYLTMLSSPNSFQTHILPAYPHSFVYFFSLFLLLLHTKPYTFECALFQDSVVKLPGAMPLNSLSQKLSTVNILSMSRNVVHIPERRTLKEQDLKMQIIPISISWEYHCVSFSS